MDKEVDEACSEGDEVSSGNNSSSSSDAEDGPEAEAGGEAKGGGFKSRRKRGRGNSSSEESLTSEFPKGWADAGRRKRKVFRENPAEDEETRESLSDHLGMGSGSSSNGNNSDAFDNSVGSDDEMAAAVEREFLGQ
jgi:hypothetical protein